MRLTSLPEGGWPRAVRRTAAVVAGAVVAALTLTAGANAATVETEKFSFDVQSAPIAHGQYQVAYSERNDVLWVTSAVGRPPIRESALTKVDPDTLEVLQTITPPAIEDGGDARLEAVYGVAVDDVNNTVWTTLTRESAVAVYSQETGERIAYIPDVNHARDVVLDVPRDRAYVSSVYGGYVAAIKLSTFELEYPIALEPGAQPMSLELVADEDSSVLYTTDLDSGDIYVIDNLAKSWSVIPTGRAGVGASGIAVDPERQRAYVSNQWVSDVTVVDLVTGQVVGTVGTSAGLLNSAFDAENDLVFSTEFHGDKVNVIDAATGEELTEIPVDIYPNHVTVAKGSAYVVDRAGSFGEKGGPDRLWKITPKAKDVEPEPEPTEPTPGPTEPTPGPTEPTPGPTEPGTPVPPQPNLPAAATVTLSQDVDVKPGSTITLSGTGFTPGQLLAVKLDRNLYGILRGTTGDGELHPDNAGDRIVVGPDGSFTDEPVTIPTASLAGVPTEDGWHWLHLLDSDPQVRFWIPISTAVGSTEPGPGTGPGPEESGTAQVDVSVSVPQDQGLVLSLENDDVSLGAADLNGSIDSLVAEGSLAGVTVTDVRSANPGWSLAGKVSDFSGESSAIDGKYLGWVPAVLSASDGQRVTAGSAVEAGAGLKFGSVLASAAAGAGRGTAKVGADLRLAVPTSTVPGTYTAVLTLTLS